MNGAFSRINAFLLFFNLCLMLGIAYLWYPTFRDARRTDAGSTSIEEGAGNLSLGTGTTNQQNNTSSDESSVTSSATTSTDNDSIDTSPAALPAIVNLPVPFTSQAPEGNWDQPWQDACEEAAILMLDAYYKNYNLSPLFAKDEILKMVDWQTARGWGYSIPIDQIEEAAADYMGSQFSFDIIQDPTIAELQGYLAAGHPVYVVADGRMLDNPNFTGEGPVYHALILRGYNDSGFITNDPGTRNGEAFFYTYDNLMASIRDWNGGNVTSGDRVVMVAKRL